MTATKLSQSTESQPTEFQSAKLQAVHDLIASREPVSLEAVREWLRRPSFSDTGVGMAEGAAYALELLKPVSSDARLVVTPGYPMVFGTTASSNPDAPWLLVYGLYDVTPLVEHEWTVPPLEARIMEAKDLGVLPHLGQVLVGRGANNHKGPVLSTILAVQAMLDAGLELPVNLIWLIEGEEEIGSPSMAAFVESHRQILERAQGAWLPCMQQNSAGTMTLRRAYKGTLFADLECVGGEWGGTRDARHVWAGNSAWIDAPMMRLVRALATLFDDDQRLTLDGLEEKLEPPVSADSPEVRALEQLFLDNPKWEANMLANLNVARFKGGKRLSDHLAYYMVGGTINVQGIQGGYQGPTFYTNMPGQARAKIDIRFPPGVTPLEVADLVTAHLNRRGHEHVKLRNFRGYSGAQALPEEDDTLLQAARKTAEMHGVNLSVWPIANNCCPSSLLTNLGKPIPFSIAGIGHGDRAHAPDEYITVGSVAQLMHWTVDYLYAWAEVMAHRPVAD
jgi:acetylornithine deacetylase/succinyl-diaminopimelate desuccinylase-like protein